MIETQNNNRGQVSIFVIVAIVLVVGAVLFFVIQGSFSFGGIPAELGPVYDLYDSCIEAETRSAIDLAGSQGGVIEVGNYEFGSEFAPQGNQLNFLGFNVPYWYYVAGNGVIKEQVPSKSEMENEIALFIEEEIVNCNFEELYRQGFEIEIERGEVDVEIEENKVIVKVTGDIVATKSEERAIKREHVIELNSRLGSFYDSAIEIYNEEIERAFLEEYAVDVLRLYAPVDGVELSCSPEVWSTREVSNEIKQGLEDNFRTIKFEGDYYILQDEGDDYFVVEGADLNGASANVIYSQNWPTKVEVLDSQGELMIANPVGNQEGLGVLGFCYVPYHFVYDIIFPVMIQIYDEQESFQFPLAVVVDNNLAREADLEVFAEINEEFELCSFADNDFEVNIFDVNLNRINANLSFECFDQVCGLGESQDGKWIGKVPSCVNGEVVAIADGFSREEQIVSSNEVSSVEVILDKEYEVNVGVTLDGSSIGNSRAIVSFTPVDEGLGASAILPDQGKIKLSEGLYELNVQVYGESGVTIPGGTREECYDAPAGVLGGFFGLTKEECFEIEVPETRLDEALIGGGSGEEYLLPADLQTGILVVNAESLPSPTTLEQLQYNFEIFDTLNAFIQF